MKNVLKLLLTVTLISTMPLDAMKREGDALPGQPPKRAKEVHVTQTPNKRDGQSDELVPQLVMKARTENNALERTITFVCDDGTSIEKVEDTAIGFVTKNDIADCITHLITTNQFDALQATLNALKVPLAIEAHQALVAYVRALSALGQMTITNLFGQLQGPSTLKMALQLVCAQKYHIDLDPDLECVTFVDNIGWWVNGLMWGNKTLLFSQAHVQYVLPLLEPLIGVPVTLLNLSCNELTSLPAQIGSLVHLEKLLLIDNKLTGLPDDMCNLVNMSTLGLSRNQFNQLPSVVCNVVSLQELNLAANNLSSIPAEIGNLVNLKTLNLRRNKLISISALGNLASLEKLFLEDNDLYNIPLEVHQLPKLETLSFQRNPCTDDQVEELQTMFCRWKPFAEGRTA